ncbi:MAG: hypothetical protein O4805_21890 [Trichodesmium sp. St16_bin2-tuft]|nr:hypothetical protein [Trichodesmium sp. St18_bin1]MDE5089628.1 hypothetical protein [Trichodesmium sp. St16_bin2-tuft]MDE5110056.1 hypothetical protein [Trichodesmium sp. St7_bin2_1]MDE5116059.1 hypothetical protein [Trichodesmium sp. St2_bin2_1]MDE5122491.1 hypothetical protein [Trichodesmium sp. St19_bin1]
MSTNRVFPHVLIWDGHLYPVSRLSGQRVAQFEGVQDIHNVRDRLLKVA